MPFRVSLQQEDFAILSLALGMYHHCLKEEYHKQEAMANPSPIRDEMTAASFLKIALNSFLEEAQKSDSELAAPVINKDQISVIVGALELFQVSLMMMREKDEDRSLRDMHIVCLQLLYSFSQTGVQSKNILRLY